MRHALCAMSFARTQLTMSNCAACLQGPQAKYRTEAGKTRKANTASHCRAHQCVTSHSLPTSPHMHCWPFTRALALRLSRRGTDASFLPCFCARAAAVILSCSGVVEMTRKCVHTRAHTHTHTHTHTHAHTHTHTHTHTQSTLIPHMHADCGRAHIALPRRANYRRTTGSTSGQGRVTCVVCCGRPSGCARSCYCNLVSRSCGARMR
jgi:hypothetical protein